MANRYNRGRVALHELESERSMDAAQEVLAGLRFKRKLPQIAERFGLDLVVFSEKAELARHLCPICLGAIKPQSACAFPADDFITAIVCRFCRRAYDDGDGEIINLRVQNRFSPKRGPSRRRFARLIAVAGRDPLPRSLR
jgi:hypothetical protein